MRRVLCTGLLSIFLFAYLHSLLFNVLRWRQPEIRTEVVRSKAVKALLWYTEVHQGWAMLSPTGSADGCCKCLYLMGGFLQPLGQQPFRLAAFWCRSLANICSGLWPLHPAWACRAAAGIWQRLWDPSAVGMGPQGRKPVSACSPRGKLLCVPA